MDPQAGTHGLQILNAQKEDAGQYTCVVTNELGEATKNYHVEVLSEPPPPRGHWLDRQKSAATLETLGLLPVTVFPESHRQPREGESLPFTTLPCGKGRLVLRLWTCCPHASPSSGFLLVWTCNLGSLSLIPGPPKGPLEATTDPPPMPAS